MLVVYDSTESDANQKLKWLVQDHLGSTRFEVGKDGSLASMKRHDYAPFGEELQGGQRATAGYGYTTAGVREKFTGYERDTETGLDYAQARYYSNVQGRFTSPDLPFVDQIQSDPQSWNIYTFVRNNPLKLTDPTGMYVWTSALGGRKSDEELRDGLANVPADRLEGETNRVNNIISKRQSFRDAITQLGKDRDFFGVTSEKGSAIAKTLTAYGAENVANNVKVEFQDNLTVRGRAVGGTTEQRGSDITVTLNSSQTLSGSGFAELVGHEGTHVYDFKRGVDGNITENNAYRVQSYLLEAHGRYGYAGTGGIVENTILYRPTWKAIDERKMRDRAINRLLNTSPVYRGNR